MVGALAALTACSGGGGKTASSTPSATPVSTSGSGAVTSASGKLQGSWITTSGGKIVALVVSGKKAGLFVTGQKDWCQGAAGKEAGMQMIHLACADGNKQRVTGMVESVDAKSMKVTWSGRTGQETYTRAEGGKLPAVPPSHLKK
ncbi:membrane protein [Streptomyces sp. MMG1121]|nr:membrane protein [Streptomyces sp. MMG1121]